MHPCRLSIDNFHTLIKIAYLLFSKWQEHELEDEDVVQIIKKVWLSKLDGPSTVSYSCLVC